MQGALSLVLLYFVGATFASIAGDDYQFMQEKPQYYPNQRTFGRSQVPAFNQYQQQTYRQANRDQAYAARSQTYAASPQAYAADTNRDYQDTSRQAYSTVDRPQAFDRQRYQQQYDQQQASAYAQPQATQKYNQASAYAQPEEAALQYDQPQASTYAQPHVDQQYKQLQSIEDAQDHFVPTNEHDAVTQAKYAEQYNRYTQEEQARYKERLAKFKKQREELEAKEAKDKPVKKQKPKKYCDASCPKWCLPDCDETCCHPKPPPMPEYLQRQQLTATACEGHKLKIKCPNRSEKIVLYSTFYGREKDGNFTCKHDVLPAKGTCNEQEHHVNEKVYDLCGNVNHCQVAVDNKFLALDNTTICPGVYKYLKVIYKCHQKPKDMLQVCPIPCQEPSGCFPKCHEGCCKKPKIKKAKIATPTPLPPAKTCPAPCGPQCKPPCTPQCCYKGLTREEIRGYLYGNKPGQIPGPRGPEPLFEDELKPYGSQQQLSQQQYAQPGYYNNAYSPYQAQQNTPNEYNDQRSACPAACSQECSSDCPPQCCSGAAPSQQYNAQNMNYYG